jgi:hypothetical protein
MKDLKKKLVAAVGMLCVSALMLTGVSYAWFTLSTSPEVTGVKANISANENLEIALDNGYDDAAAIDTASNNTTAGGVQGSTTSNPYTWGNLVNLDYAFGSTGINGKLTLKPVKYNANVTSKLQYPVYGTDGRIKELSDLTAFKVSDYDGVTASGGVIKYGQNATEGSNTSFDALSVTYWLRSNMATNVSLSAAGVARAKSSEDNATATTTATDPNQILGGGSYISFPTTATTDAAKAVEKEEIWTLVSNYLTIRFDVVNGSSTTSYYAVPEATAAVDASSNAYKYTLKLVSRTTTIDNTTKIATNTDAAATIALTADNAAKATMYVYLDGENITNASALTADLSNMVLNIQFTGTDVDDAMDVSAASN